MAGENGKLSSSLGPLPEGWTIVRLGNLCTKIGTGATPRGGQKVYLDRRENYALVRSQHVFDRHFEPAGLAFITDSHANELQSAKIEPHDVLLNITGDGVTFGRACIVPESILPACVNQHVSIIRLDKNRCLPGYLVSFLTHPLVKHYIESFNAGGSRRAVTKGHIKSFEIPLPPLSEQEAIAHILGTLDDKIELNRRMNETLGAMARATFKSWFIDFDPVRAKMDGRRPAGMDDATAALFPDSFEDSQYGRIPRSWKISTLGDEVDLLTGFPFKSKEYTDSDNSVRLVRGDNIVQSRLRWQNVKRWPVRLLDGLDRYQLVSGDVVLAMDRPWIEAGLKYAWISDHDMPCLLVQRVARLRSREDRIGGSFLRLLIGSPQFTQYVLAIQTGTAVPHISGTQIKSFAFSRPPFNDEALLRRFEDMLEPILEKHDRNEGESQRLSTIRDTLLPKLLSGEIRVSEAEQTVAEVA